MFTRVNADLGARIKKETESMITANEQMKMAKSMSSVQISESKTFKNGVTNGHSSHNSGMFAHKQWGMLA